MHPDRHYSALGGVPVGPDTRPRVRIVAGTLRPISSSERLVGGVDSIEVGGSRLA